MKVWAAAALAGWIALWMVVYRGKRRQRTALRQISEVAGHGLGAPEATSCSGVAVERDIEGSAGADPELDRDDRGGDDR